MSSSTASMNMNMNMGNMAGLSACSGDSKPMQFPLTQRRKRRVLFTQAQVSHRGFETLFGDELSEGRAILPGAAKLALAEDFRFNRLMAPSSPISWGTGTGSWGRDDD